MRLLCTSSQTQHSLEEAWLRSGVLSVQGAALGLSWSLMVSLNLTTNEGREVDLVLVLILFLALMVSKLVESLLIHSCLLELVLVRLVGVYVSILRRDTTEAFPLGSFRVFAGESGLCG